MPEQLLKRQTLERIATGPSLISRAFGFSIFGTLIIANWHQADLGTIDRDLHKFTGSKIRAVQNAGKVIQEGA
jgi:hypothetical protein